MIRARQACQDGQVWKGLLIYDGAIASLSED